MMHQCRDGYSGRRNVLRWMGFATGQRNAALTAVCLLVLLLAVGCTSTGTFPQTSATQVDLSRKNFHIVKANAIGSSSGFELFGFIPFSAPTYTRAMADLYEKAGVTEGKAQTLTNVTQERSSLYLLLFSIPKLTVRADVIEFTE
jgi:hypothetical protein